VQAATRIRWWIPIALVLLLVIAAAGGRAVRADAVTSTGAIGPVTPKDVVYQIITDRFVNGDTTNDTPAGFDPTLFDGTGSDLKLYQGGDWQGIINKITYLKNMGITAVWISAPYENRDTEIDDFHPGGPTDRWTSFHGYHVRNYFATNKHFGLLAKFKSLRDALHAQGMKLIIDFVTNHTSRYQNPTNGFSPEDGKLYEPDKDGSGNYCFNAAGDPYDCSGDGVVENLLADPNNNVAGWFHDLGDRGADSSQFGYRWKDLGSLGDFSQENANVVAHLEKAALYWKALGLDGFRHDATLHMNPAFSEDLKDAIDSAPGGPLGHFGEFFIGRPDPKYDEYRSFPDRTGINNLDFEYYRASTNAFGNFSETMSQFGSMLTQTSSDYIYENQAVTFLDNHDVTRFRFIQPNDKPYHAAIATLLTARGTPNIYYGTEQYLSSVDASDVAGRVYMQVASPAFSQTTTAYKTIQSLSALRQSNDALAYGQTSVLYSNNDVLVFSRKFYDKEVIVAVNRQPTNSFTVPALTTTVPNGTYTDTLTGLLFGASETVSGGQLASFVLSPGEVDVWSYNPSLGTTIPRIGDVESTMGRVGNIVYIRGTGLASPTSVKFGTTVATVTSSSDTLIETTVPVGVTPGVLDITVTKGANVSNTFRYNVLSGDQVQVIFHVTATTVSGENVYVSGSIPELGNWDPTKATEVMLNPSYPAWFLPISVPKSTTFQFKFIKKNAAGAVTWEGGTNRSFTSSSSSTGTSDTANLTWQP
jgi:glycosidase